MFKHVLASPTVPNLTSPPPSPLPSPLVNRMAGLMPTDTTPHQTDAAPHLSYSQIKRFTNCPLQWRLSREYAPAFIPAALAFGGGFHAAVEAFYRARLAGRIAGIDELPAAYDRHWVRETSGNNPPVRFTAKLEDAAGMRDLATRMFRAFLADVRPGEVVAVEESFAVTLAPDLPPVVGRIDLVEIREDADGIRRLHLVDFKTAARRPTGEDLDSDQLLLYALAAEQAGWAKSFGLPSALSFDVTTKTKTPERLSVSVTATQHGLARLGEKIRQCDRAMRAGVCYPAESWACVSCGYAECCAKWPELPAATAA